MSEQDAQIHQLQQQQAMFTSALQAMLEGKWIGDGSVEALLYALNPNLVGTTLIYDLPVTESELEAPKG